MTAALRVMTVYGTRPEAIKVAPVIRALATDGRFDPVTVVSGQHREMLDSVNTVFGIRPDHDLDVFAPGAGLAGIVSRTLERVDAVLATEQPDVVLVQGDTSTATAAALAAFYSRVPVVHLEAGLRTHDVSSPFPEELNRRQISQVARLHLAPTATSAGNLLREGVDAAAVLVTGNTVIDALRLVLAAQPVDDGHRAARGADGTDRRTVLVTAHRRESWGAGLARVARAVRRLALRFPDVRFVCPLHRNPEASGPMTAELAGLKNVLLGPPLDYPAFCRLLASAHVVLSDSGGIQEEAPSLGVPLVLLRECTERPEAVEAGAVLPAGTDEDAIVASTTRLLRDAAAHRAASRVANPFGDGRATERVLGALSWLAGTGERPADFEPETTEVAAR